MPDASPLHQRFQSWITHRYFVRLHMTVMLTVVVLSGVLASHAMRAANVRWLVVRYPIAVLFSYAVFFLLVRLWLAYAMRVRRRQSGSDGSWSLPDDLFGGRSSGGSPGVSGGGSFGGGGASGSFEDSGGGAARMAAMPVPQPAGGGGSGSGSGGGGGFGLDDDGLMILLAFLVAVAGILAAGIILVVHAPVILSEAAFQAALAAGLLKASREMHRDGWMESVFKATLFPFLLAFAAAAVFGGAAFHYCPSGTTLAEVFRTCVFK